MFQVMVVKLTDIWGVFGPGGPYSILLHEVFEIEAQLTIFTGNDGTKKVRVFRVTES